MKNIKCNNIIGIDISKNTFDVALLINNKLKDSNIFSNDNNGFKSLLLLTLRKSFEN